MVSLPRWLYTVNQAMLRAKVRWSLPRKKCGQPSTLCDASLATADHLIVFVLEFGFPVRLVGLTLLALEHVSVCHQGCVSVTA